MTKNMIEEANELLEQVSKTQKSYLAADRKDSKAFWKAHSEWIDAVETYKASVRR